MTHGSHGFNLSSIGWALLGLSFLPRKRGSQCQMVNFVQNAACRCKLWPSLHNLFMKVNELKQVVGNGFGSQLCPYRTDQPMNLPLLPSKWSITPQKNSNGPIFMYDLIKSCLTSHSMLMLALTPMVRNSSSCPRKTSSPSCPESSKASNPLNRCQIHLLFASTHVL